MKITAAWATFVVALGVPIVTSLIILNSNVQRLQVSKADVADLNELKLEFTKQMTKNTSAIENLNITLREMKEVLNGS